MRAYFPESGARPTILGRLLLGCVLVLALSTYTNRTLAANEPQTLTRVAGAPAAKDFSLQGMDGKPYRLADFRGKVVLVNFWATWCPPCRKELPSLERLWQSLDHKKFEILAVNLGQNPGTIFEFTAALNPPLSFPILLDRNSAVFKAWSVMGIPTTFVVNQEGRVIYRAVGGRKFDDPHLVDQIKSLVK